MTLLGLMTLVLIPSDSLQRFDLETAVARIEQDLRFARELAATTNTNCGVSFIANGNYTVYRQSTATPVASPLTRQDLVVDIGSLFDNVRLANSAQVEFSPLGRPLLGGGQTIQITDGATTASLLVTSDTGVIVRQ